MLWGLLERLCSSGFNHEFNDESQHEFDSTKVSLRRELNQRTDELLPELSEAEDLSQWSHARLESEVIALRHSLNMRNAAVVKEMEQIRDLLSHTATGKHDSLQLNATLPTVFPKSSGDNLYPQYNRVDSDNVPSEEMGGPIGIILSNAWSRAVGFTCGGAPGAIAMAAQVGSLMWLRTTMNYQYRYGTTTMQAIRALYNAGGIRRFYKGMGFALILGPLGRFGDTAANTGVLYTLDSFEPTRNIPNTAKSVVAAAAAAGWRILLMPLDACKTVMQVEGISGLSLLQKKCRIPWNVTSNSTQVTNIGTKDLSMRPSVLFHGSSLHFSATFIGHYTWFFVYNTLNNYLPEIDTLQGKLLRNATVGFLASLVSDTTTNSLRVAKTVRQTFHTSISYYNSIHVVVGSQKGLKMNKQVQQTPKRKIRKEAFKTILKLTHEQWSELFFRGLSTRLLANGLQGALFTVLWKGFESMLDKDVD